MMVGGEVSTYTVQDGDTLSSIEQKTGGDMRDIAEANQIEDPMNPPVGETVVVPSDAEQAAVLERRRARAHGQRRGDGRAHKRGGRHRLRSRRQRGRLVHVRRARTLSRRAASSTSARA